MQKKVKNFSEFGAKGHIKYIDGENLEIHYNKFLQPLICGR
jgi:hypothetical protein